MTGEPGDELDRLAAELELVGRDMPGPDAGLEAWLEVMAERSASDLLLLSGEPPVLRVHGRIVRASDTPLDSSEIETMVSALLPPHARQSYRAHGNADASYRASASGRYRINLHRERGRAAACIR